MDVGDVHLFNHAFVLKLSRVFVLARRDSLCSEILSNLSDILPIFLVSYFRRNRSLPLITEPGLGLLLRETPEYVRSGIMGGW